MKEMEKNVFCLTFDSAEKNLKDKIFIKNETEKQFFKEILGDLLTTDIEVSDSKWRISISNKDELLKYIEKIPEIDMNSVKDTSIVEIDKDLVHKKLQENVLISEHILNIDTPIKIFEGSPCRTLEIILDHIHEDHVEAINLGEIARQSGMVTLGKVLGKRAEYYIVGELKNYYNIVKRDKKVQIQTFPVIAKKKRGIGLCLFGVYQNFKLCMSGYYVVVYDRKYPDNGKN